MNAPACWFCGRDGDAHKRDRLADHDHHFTPEQEREYGTLPWRGRDAYDHARWFIADCDHARALRLAVGAYGTK